MGENELIKKGDLIIWNNSKGIIFIENIKTGSIVRVSTDKESITMLSENSWCIPYCIDGHNGFRTIKKES